MVRIPRIFLVVMITLIVRPLIAAEPAEIAALRLKAERGNGLAQYNLGLAYAEGEAVPADLPEAFVWLSLASSNGATGKALDQVLGNITDAQLAEGRRRLEEYRTAIAAKAATQPVAPIHKPSSRGFTLYPAAGGAPADPPADDTATVTKGPRASTTPPDKPITPAEEQVNRLRLELAQAKDLIGEQAATIAKLKAELKRQEETSLRR
jgi:TPR repeat protein